MFLAVAVLCGLAFAYISDLTLFQARHIPYALFLLSLQHALALLRGSIAGAQGPACLHCYFLDL